MFWLQVYCCGTVVVYAVSMVVQQIACNYITEILLKKVTSLETVHVHIKFKPGIQFMKVGYI